MMMRACDVMRRQVVTVTEDHTLKELEAILIDNKITGVPVLDAKGRVIGVVSQTDLVRRDREQAPPHENPAYDQALDRWLGRSGLQVEAPDFVRVRDVMTPSACCAEEDAPLWEVARLMAQSGIHRVVITRKGRLAGIVTSMDILRAFVAMAENGGAKA